MRFIILTIIIISSVFGKSQNIRFDINDFTTEINKVNYREATSYAVVDDYIVPQFNIEINSSFRITNINYTESNLEFVSITLNRFVDTGYFPDKFDGQRIKESISGFMKDKYINKISVTPFIVKNDSLFLIQNFTLSYDEIDTGGDHKGTLVNSKNMLIITSNSMETVFNRVKKITLEFGYTPEIVTVDEIYQKSFGSSNIMMIRNYIKDYYRVYGLNTVLILGGNGVVPIPITKPFSVEEDVPSDLLYSCLDGEFDGNHNGILGEVDDNCDLLPDVLLSRIPLETANEVTKYFDKLESYISGNDHWKNTYGKNLIMGFNLFSPGDYEPYCNLFASIIPENQYYEKFYEHNNPFFTLDSALSLIDRGWNIIYSQSHGNYDRIGMPYGWVLNNATISNCENPSAVSIISACRAGDFSKLSYSYNMITSENGSIIYIGSSVSDYPGISYLIGKKYGDRIFLNENSVSSLANAKIDALNNINGNNHGRLLYFAYNHIGFPLFKLISDNMSLTIDLPANLAKGSGVLSLLYQSEEFSETEVVLLSDEGIVGSGITHNNFTSDINYFELNSDSAEIILNSQYFPKKRYKICTDNDFSINLDSISVLGGYIQAGKSTTLKLHLSQENYMNADTIKYTISSNIPEINIEKYQGSFPVVPFNGSFNRSVTEIECDNFYLTERDTCAVFHIEIYSNERVLVSEDHKIDITTPRIEYVCAELDTTEMNLRILLRNSSLMSFQNVVLEIYDDNNLIIGSSSIPYVASKSMILSDFFGSLQLDLNFYVKIIYDDCISISNIIKFKVLDESSTFINHFSISNDLGELSWIGYESKYFISDIEGNILNPSLIMGNSFTSPLFDTEKEYILYGIDDFSIIKYRSEPVRLKGLNELTNFPLKIGNVDLQEPYMVDDNLFVMNRAGDIFKYSDNSFSCMYNSGTLQYTSGDHTNGMAYGDLNGDDIPEFVSYNFFVGDSSFVNIIDLNGSLITSKKFYGFLYNTYPVISDLDDDGINELFVTCFDDNLANQYGGIIYIYDLIGNELIEKSISPITSSNNHYRINSPLVADVNDDGIIEIIFNSGNKIQIFNAQTGALLLSKAYEKSIIGPVKAIDFEGDQIFEITFGIECNSDNLGKIVLCNLIGNDLVDKNGFENGIVVEGYTDIGIYARNDAPVFADIDKNGTVELIYVTGKKLYVICENGQNYPNFPTDVFSFNENMSSPSFADIDNDNFLDILTGSDEGFIYAYSGATGDMIDNFPLSIGEKIEKAKIRPIAIHDIDDDGDFEFILSDSFAALHVFECPIPYDNDFTLQKSKFDDCNTGVFDTNYLTKIMNDKLVSSFDLYDAYPNPFNPETNIRFSTNSPGKAILNVYNSNGQKVYSFSKDYDTTGLKNIIFNADNFSSGVYFYSVEFAERVKTGKMVMLK
ncbi:MAG: T9SS type A sorting domain-containing protein [Candidatus Delongbacteria bacterium]|nr:T9SS type A sorting domain-containing protein [Candidatus Delongbacteria bacterium]MBN2836184.1 T9SS type A sorting domain-containing protein [Candidatus Delongbacteria bacterium]